MFLKRSIVLMAGLCLFIIGFIIYFEVTDSRMEEAFRQERIKFGVENTVLTASAADATKSAPPAPDTTPAPDASTNSLIGPVPPTPSSDTTAPAPVPASTEYREPEGRPSFLVEASYRPTFAQVPAAPVPDTTPTASATTVAPSTSASSTNAPVALPASSVSDSTTSSASPVHSNQVGGTIIVLGYHQFTGPGVPSKNIYSMRQDVFAAEMKYLHDNGYHVVPLSDVVRFIKREITVPPNTVAITIDDGYKSPILWAAPVLKQYNYPWTFFVYPDFLTVAEGKGAASWNDLKALQADGVDIECHSKSHPILTKHGSKTPDQYDAWLTAETAGAKATIEQHLGTPVRYFAYPYGAYNKQVEAKTIAAGFEGIFTVADNPVHITTDPHSIGRYIITTPVEKNFAAYLRQGALSVAEADPSPGATISQARPVITAVLGYAGNLDPKSIEAEVRDFGRVPCDYDPKTSTVRLYLQRDLIQSEVIVNIRARDAQTGQVMVANWHFNFEPAPGAPSAAQPITGAPGATNSTANPPPAMAAPVPSVTNQAPTPAQPVGAPVK